MGEGITLRGGTILPFHLPASPAPAPTPSSSSELHGRPETRGRGGVPEAPGPPGAGRGTSRLRPWVSLLQVGAVGNGGEALVRAGEGSGHSRACRTLRAAPPGGTLPGWGQCGGPCQGTTLLVWVLFRARVPKDERGGGVPAEELGRGWQGTPPSCSPSGHCSGVGGWHLPSGAGPGGGGLTRVSPHQRTPAQPKISHFPARWGGGQRKRAPGTPGPDPEQLTGGVWGSGGLPAQPCSLGTGEGRGSLSHPIAGHLSAQPADSQTLGPLFAPSPPPRFPSTPVPPSTPLQPFPFTCRILI